ncbi:putative CUE domain protein [Aspergillus saccharolyticus JOP 1030-1]|uniref:GRF zinc finger domain protein n=1 Tax=Aspergillus saccharolyticus JOP 1030-1 TaxID=1450539 RepID=A0A318ZDU9_9EURO|nr:GRF zinc finger domain protein [Aspergillus saccharolyticus JOP 1030-1]PYH45696.1 GRF zinc finger domain protein [Aspergillus saccharolyticus JOP 1030-1]
MDQYLSRKRTRSPPVPACADDDSTDMKLTRLVSLFPDMALDALMEILLSSGGCVETATTTIQAQPDVTKKRIAPLSAAATAIQTSLDAHMRQIHTDHSDKTPKRPLTRRGKTLHLYSPEDIAAHTPCSIIHNFLPAEQANALLLELLDESKHFSRYRFQLFDRTVQSPHSASIYVATPEQHRQHTSEYTYGGSYRSTVRQITPHLRAVSGAVQRAVNAEIQRRIRTVYPEGQKLKYQSPREWVPNAAFVNCYDGPTEAVGFHSDELTYLGPRAVIGSLSLGVEREFRVRRIVPTDDDGEVEEENPQVLPEDISEGVVAVTPMADKASASDSLNKQHRPNKRHKPSTSSLSARADAQGQISIHLLHNSLLVMHAEMQEEWKHAIVPAQTISPHPLAGRRRINVTYRWYRDSLHPRHTPRCLCGAHTILRCVQRKRETRGRYMWMCYAGYAPGKKGCSFFQWADFDDDGEPLWERTTVDDDDAPWLENFADGEGQLAHGAQPGNEEERSI